MTKLRDKTVLPQLTMPEKLTKYYIHLSPPVFRFEIDDNIIEMLIDEVRRIRKKISKNIDKEII